VVPTWRGTPRGSDPKSPQERAFATKRRGRAAVARCGRRRSSSRCWDPHYRGWRRRAGRSRDGLGISRKLLVSRSAARRHRRPRGLRRVPDGPVRFAPRAPNANRNRSSATAARADNIGPIIPWQATNPADRAQPSSDKQPRPASGSALGGGSRSLSYFQHRATGQRRLLGLSVLSHLATPRP
jgi:hypothetical protein